MTGDIAGKRRRNEARTLIRPPILSQYPAHSRSVCRGVDYVVRSTPGEQLYLIDVFTEGASQRITSLDLEAARLSPRIPIAPLAWELERVRLRPWAMDKA